MYHQLVIHGKYYKFFFLLSLEANLGDITFEFLLGEFLLGDYLKITLQQPI